MRTADSATKPVVIFSLKQARSLINWERDRESDHKRFGTHVPPFTPGAHICGKLGEAAVARYLGVPVNTETTVQSCDLKIGRLCIEVKSTKYDSGALVLNSLDELKRAEVFVLTVPRINDDGARVTLVGWIDANRFQEVCGYRDFGYGLRWFVDQNYLQLMSQLLWLATGAKLAERSCP